MQNPEVRWRIYYADRSTFSNLDGEPWQAPATGVIVIAQRNPLPNENPYIQHMTDYYCWLGDCWLGCDQFRLYQYWFIDGWKHDFRRACLAGETVTNERFLEIRHLAKQDPDIFR